jgi:hypothetical protein
MLRLAVEAQATIEHNVFIDEAGVTAGYAPLIHVAGVSTATLSHNLFYGVASTLPIGTLDETIPYAQPQPLPRPHHALAD